MESYFQTLYGTFWGGVLQLFKKSSDFLEQLQNKPLEHS